LANPQPKDHKEAQKHGGFLVEFGRITARPKPFIVAP